MTGEGRHPDRVPMRERAESLPAPALGGPVIEARRPIQVRAWVSKPGRGVVPVHGAAIAWTAKAVRVELVDEHARSEQVWVWANAVERIEEATRPFAKPATGGRRGS